MSKQRCVGFTTSAARQRRGVSDVLLLAIEDKLSEVCDQCDQAQRAGVLKVPPLALHFECTPPHDNTEPCGWDAQAQIVAIAKLE